MKKINHIIHLIYNYYRFHLNFQVLRIQVVSNEIEKLPLIQDKGIIDNIIYSGMLNKLDKKENTDERPI